jgi:flagellar motor switch protein FliN/FliY
MSGTDANDGGMLTQEALDAMLAEMGPEDPGTYSEDILSTVGAAAMQAAQSAEPSPAAVSPSLSFVSFGDSSPQLGDDSSGSFERVQDITLEIAVELGRTRMLIKDILDLTSGSIIELEKIAGEPVDLLANGLLIARGEVVVVEDSFGVRITQVITAAGRKEIASNTLHKAIQ